MLVSTSCEEKLDKKLERKFKKAKKHQKIINEDFNNFISEENLFKKRTKFYFDEENSRKNSSKSKKILTENSGIINKKSSSDVVVLLKVGLKRKIDEDIESLSDRIMYDYRHQVTNGNSNNNGKSSNDASYNNGNNKIEPADDNLVNIYLGGSNNSIATLCNIGNSCYLNSVIYTLRFAPHFLHKLHHLVDDMRHVYQKIGQHKTKSSSLGRNVGGLQSNSGRSWSSKDLVSLNNINGIDNVQKTNRQIATEKLHELYQSLHRNESIDSSESFHAGTFLQAIQDVSSVFEGNQQQDAHELLMCILDSIRETCSTLIKTIKDHPEIIYQNLTNHETSNDLTSPPAHANINSSQSLKSIFSRKIRRKDTMKSNNGSAGGGVNSPIKENVADNNGGSIDDETIDNSANVNKSENENSSLNSNDSSSSDKINEVIKRLGLDFFCKDFEGITLFTTKCLTCETVTEQKETMIDIAIPISHDNLSQPIDPQMFFQNSCITREYFRVENHYRCDKCCGYTEAYRSISFEVLPRLLVLHIKRFSGGMEKISTYSPTPFILKCFCNKCYKKKDEEKLHYYKLYSVITHVGATMSVGHYIAYTCSLDIYNEYVNCCYGKRKLSFQSNNHHHHSTMNQQMNNVGGGEKNSGLMKKLIYGRNKASSSGDMSKSLKPINGLSKMMINGIEKLSLNSDKNNVNANTNGTNAGSAPSSPPKTVCTSSNCCGIYVKNFSTLVENYHNSMSQQEKSNTNATIDENLPEDCSLNSNSSTKNSLNDINQKTWYMCDDDKIKVMTQKEFEDALSKNQKVMITPYLLFYARFDVTENHSNT